MIVTLATRIGDSPAHQSYLTRVLRRAGTTPALCRQTRVSQLVTDLNPKLAATALGMQDAGLIRYLAGNVDSDRLPVNENGLDNHVLTRSFALPGVQPE